MAPMHCCLIAPICVILRQTPEVKAQIGMQNWALDGLMLINAYQSCHCDSQIDLLWACVERCIAESARLTAIACCCWWEQTQTNVTGMHASERQSPLKNIYFAELRGHKGLGCPHSGGQHLAFAPATSLHLLLSASNTPLMPPCVTCFTPFAKTPLNSHSPQVCTSLNKFCTERRNVPCLADTDAPPQSTA